CEERWPRLIRQSDARFGVGFVTNRLVGNRLLGEGRGNFSGFSFAHSEKVTIFAQQTRMADAVH
ncbi:MAG: hypothetical protein ACI3YD_00405, partial [Alloprevotella sp.]